MNQVKLIDFLTGKQVWKYYQLYQKTQWFSKAEIKELQLLKLKALLKHCFINVPYYSALIEKNHINIENFDSTDILSEFPLLTKEIIQANYNAFIPKNINLIKGVKSSQTGGTTGNILIKRNDANTRSSVWATYQRFNDWMGVKDGDRKLILMGGHVLHHSRFDVKNQIANYISNFDTFNPYDNTSENTNKIIEALSTRHYKLIRGYSQSLFQFAKLLESEGLKFNVASITTTAEPLMDIQRELFRKVFGAESFDQYGCGEIGGIAYECDHHKGLHVAEERIFLEINDKNELIITDLDNFAMPLIRYWNADQAIVSKDLCTCGRQSSLLDKIMGRTCDYIYGVGGRSIHWAYFWHLVFESNIGTGRNLRKFQVRQISETEIQFRLVSEKLDRAEEEIITRDMKERLGNIRIQFIYEKDIENSSSGKYRPVVNQIIERA